MSELFNTDVIDEALAEILTPEQQEELEAVKKREIANKVEAQALKELAKLSNLDLSQEQKDAAYDILYKNAETSVGNETPATGPCFDDHRGILGSNWTPIPWELLRR